MSQENVEALDRGNLAFRSGDWKAVAANLDPDILIRADARWPEQRIYGREAALAFYRGLWESGGPDISIDERLDLGDRVLTRMRWNIHGHLSGIEGEQPASTICTFRNGRVILEEFFIDHHEALKAVGLEE